MSSAVQTNLIISNTTENIHQTGQTEADGSAKLQPSDSQWPQNINSALGMAVTIDLNRSQASGVDFIEQALVT